MSASLITMDKESHPSALFVWSHQRCQCPQQYRRQNRSRLGSLPLASEGGLCLREQLCTHDATDPFLFFVLANAGERDGSADLTAVYASHRGSRRDHRSVAPGATRTARQENGGQRSPLDAMPGSSARHGSVGRTRPGREQRSQDLKACPVAEAGSTDRSDAYAGTVGLSL